MARGTWKIRGVVGGGGTKCSSDLLNLSAGSALSRREVRGLPAGFAWLFPGLEHHTASPFYLHRAFRSLRTQHPSPFRT